MKKLIAVFGVLCLWTTIAVADEAPPAATTPDPAAETTPEPQDCSALEGDEKTKCEEAQAAPAPPTPEAGKAGKGGKGGLTKSEDGRMESFDEDE
jgi:hypothetical protein